MVTHIGGPAVEMRVIGVAMTPGIPGGHPPTGIRDHRSEHIEGSRKIEAPVHHGNKRRFLVTPLVQRESETATHDMSGAIRGSGSGIGAHLVVVRHGSPA